MFAYETVMLDVYIVASRIDASRHDLCVAPLTWLILPVVTCLSQRLSHAWSQYQLSQLHCEWLIKTVIVYLMAFIIWIPLEILELTHASRPDL